MQVITAWLNHCLALDLGIRFWTVRDDWVLMNKKGVIVKGMNSTISSSSWTKPKQGSKIDHFSLKWTFFMSWLFLLEWSLSPIYTKYSKRIHLQTSPSLPWSQAYSLDKLFLSASVSSPQHSMRMFSIDSLLQSTNKAWPGTWDSNNPKIVGTHIPTSMNCVTGWGP